MTFAPEQNARQEIDKKLEKAGWVVEQLEKTIVAAGLPQNFGIKYLIGSIMRFWMHLL